MEWLKEVSGKIASNAIFDLDESYKVFYRRVKRGEKPGFPKFKSRAKSKPSFGLDAETVRFYEDGVQLQKIGHVQFKFDLPLEQLQAMKLYNTRISFSNGKWMLSCSMEVSATTPKLHDFSVGIDLGIKTLAVVSCDGKFYKAKNINKSHKVRRLTKQLKHHQRAFSRKEKGSKNREKARKKVSKVYGRLRNIRRDYTHKVTRKIVNLLPQRIVMEDLNVSGMLKNHHLARAISEQNFSEFRRQIDYKARDMGIEVKVADRFFPSSRLCSCCGNKRETLLLSERVYKCPVCGTELDRDENAAMNLEKAV
jgi:putative transposase